MTRSEFIQYSLEGWGHEYNEDELDVLERADFECEDCGRKADDASDYFAIQDNTALCEYCHVEKYYQCCDLCEDDFPKVHTPEDTLLAVHKSLIEEAGLKIVPGLYRVLNFPYHFGSIFGFNGFVLGSTALEIEVDIEAIKNREDIRSGPICPDCWKKYGGKDTDGGVIKREEGK